MIHARIRLSVVAADTLPGSQTKTGEARIKVQFYAHVWHVRSGGCPADTLTFVHQCDRNPIGSGEGQRAFRNQLQNFKEQKLIRIPAGGRGSAAESRFASTTLFDLFVQGREGEQSLQRIAARDRDLPSGHARILRAVEGSL